MMKFYFFHSKLRKQLFAKDVIAKSFLRGGQMFQTTCNSFKICSTHFSRGDEKFCGEVLQLRACVHIAL